MGKPTGFIEFNRETIPYRSIEDRIKDWKEIHTKKNDSKVATQAARCMDCGTPFCHTGTLIKNIASGCPINNLIPEFNDLVYNGEWEKAFLRLKKTNNFPEFTGRVCPAPCEGSCTLGVIEPPVAIKDIECSIIEKAFEEKWEKANPPKSRSGLTVAIIGSGPAGLSCADELNKLGHKVTVYERADRIGGLLMYGIPNMKLDKKEVVLRRVKIMEEEGVKFVTNADIGKNQSAQEIYKKYDSVVLCCGATKPRDLPVEGRNAKGVHFAMEYLTENTKNILDNNLKNSNPKITAKGKEVVVIGGGDTGTDCVGTSLRQGCKNVIQLEILPKPPDERAEDNPWPEWPKVYKADYGQQEAAEIQGKDPREFLVMTRKFITENDKVTGIEVVKVKWEKNDKGAFIPKEVKNSSRVIPAQLVLLAMGFLGPENDIIKALDIETDERTNVKAKYGKFSTNIKGIFSAGDMRRGQSLVVWAINEGRGAARACHNFLLKKNKKINQN